MYACTDAGVYSYIIFDLGLIDRFCVFVCLVCVFLFADSLDTCECMYVCLYVCLSVCRYALVPHTRPWSRSAVDFVCMCVCLYVCLVCMFLFPDYLDAYECIYACLYVCLYVCMFEHT